MLQVLGRANSVNVMKVVWLLEEMGLPYMRKDVGGAFGGNDTADYRAMNPNALVPTIIEEGGFTLWESNAILRYLAAAHAAGHRFWPQDLHARAHVDRWMDWQHTVLNPPMRPIFWGLVRTAPEKRDMAAIHEAAAQCARAYAMLDAELARHAYIAGPELTLCDISLGGFVHRWFNVDGIERPDQPHLRAWYDRLLARPAYKAHVAMLPLT